MPRGAVRAKSDFASGMQAIVARFGAASVVEEAPKASGNIVIANTGAETEDAQEEETAKPNIAAPFSGSTQVIGAIQTQTTAQTAVLAYAGGQQTTYRVCTSGATSAAVFVSLLIFR